MATAAVLHLTAAPCAYCATFEPAEEEGQLVPHPAASSAGDGDALRRSWSTRLGAGGAGGSGRTSHAADRSLVLRYVAASPGLEFVVGQVSCWRAVLLPLREGWPGRNTLPGPGCGCKDG
jgi:hypothetical protein